MQFRCATFNAGRTFFAEDFGAATACAFVLDTLRRGTIIDCAPLAEVLGVRL